MDESLDPEDVRKHSDILTQWFLQAETPRISRVPEDEITSRATDFFKDLYGYAPSTEYDGYEVGALAQLLKSDVVDPIHTTIVDTESKAWRYPTEEDRRAFPYGFKQSECLSWGGRWVERFHGKYSLLWYFEQFIYQRGLVNAYRRLGEYDLAIHYAQYVGSYVARQYAAYEWRPGVVGQSQIAGARKGAQTKAENNKPRISKRDKDIWFEAGLLREKNSALSDGDLTDILIRTHPELTNGLSRNYLRKIIGRGRNKKLDIC